MERAARLLLFLDFDGTLAPIVDFPEDAAMPESTRAVLLAMARRPDFLLSLISGRSIRDLSQRAGVAPVILAGNHGLEIHGPELDWVEPAAVKLGPALRALQGELRARLFPVEGVEIENKNLSTSVHFRRAPNARDAIFQTIDEFADPGLFRVREGKMVAEILPRVDADKGTAVRWIRARREVEGDLTVCAGDDTTDEDLFRAAGDGLTIKVGDPASTAAEYFVNGADSLRGFLIWLLQIKEPAARPPAVHEATGNGR
ncbi:MAG TPA: trehalose-phosphatase [Bryobacteraceae bacterium]|nr:trehalose-phosphatase [Bryobacteraceae bacterium]